ncbi:MAG: nuclear transport factor 2 family protein [Actinomycetota bacterium]
MSDHLDLVDTWARLFNDDPEQLIRTLYAEGCTFGGHALTHAQLIALERRVLDAAPNRRAVIDRRHAIGDGVVVEGRLLDPDQGDDWQLPFCVVLTISDGLIVADNTYTDFSRWPGMG